MAPIAETSSCPSQSMEMVASQRPRASMRPQSRAFWWPRLRDRLTPRKAASRAASPQTISQVPSVEPSSTKRTWLAGLIFPAASSSSSSARKRPLVMGSTSDSL